MLRVEVLGPVAVRRDGEVLTVPSGRATEVLIRLALDAGRPVRTDRLIDDIWGSAGAGTARNTLQSKVSQLRRALGDPSLLTSSSDSYTLRVEPSAIDAVLVEELSQRVAAFRREGDAAAVLRPASEALGHFAGDTLAAAGDGDWAAAQRTRLDEVRMALVEDRLWARIELGAGGEVVGELEGLVDAHPLREGLWVLLIAALYRTGRQADALAAYSRVRASLVEELGLEPGPELQELEARVLRQDPSLVAAARGPVLEMAPGNLPRRAGDLVGRVDEVAAVRAGLARERLVTLVGPAGVGKTRLAIEVAREVERPGGVWLVRLDAIAADSGADLDGVVAATLSQPDRAALVERLRGAPTLLVIDNCEHLVDQVAEVVDSLLDDVASLSVLATSQVPLALDGEHVQVLEPLGLSASIELFADRATATRPRFEMDDVTADAVEDLCRSLDGLPLAIELAAARVRSLSVPEIGRRLEERFVLLRDPSGRGPERRRALAAAISWSYDLLFPDDQRGLWAMSCGAGGMSLGAVEHVLTALEVPPDAAVDVIDRLVDRSLVTVDERPDGTVRYRTLDSIRAFGARQLLGSGLQDVASRAHAEWLAARADEHDRLVRGAGQVAAMSFARDERANVDAALAWTAANDPSLGLRLAAAMGWTWVVLGDGVAGAQRLRDAVDSTVDASVADRIGALLCAGWLEASAGEVALAQADLDRAAEIIESAAQTTDPESLDSLRADLHRHSAFLRIQQGRAEDVVREAAMAISLDEPAGRTWQVAGSLLLSAFGSIMRGDAARAGESAGAAVDLLTPIGDSWALVHAAAMLGGVAELEGRTDVAVIALEQAAAESERLGFLGQAALHLTSLGRIRRVAGAPSAAAGTLDEALAAAARAGDLRMAATARVELARALHDTGEVDAAIGVVSDAVDWYRSAGGDGELLARCLLAAWTDDEEELTSVRLAAERAGDVDLVELADSIRSAGTSGPAAPR